MPHAPAIRALGAELPIHYNARCGVQAKRCDKAVATADRVGLLRLSPHHAYDVLAAVASPQYAYGIQPTPIPSSQHAALKSAFQKASQAHKRAHSWHMLHALVHKTHRTDPESVAIYTHMVTLGRALRNSVHLQATWARLWSVHRRAPRGPQAVFKMYLLRLNAHDLSPFVFEHPTAGRLDLLTASPAEWGHWLRNCLRNRLLRLADHARVRLRGAATIDIAQSVTLIRKMHPLRQTLVAILTDGLWTMQRHRQAQHQESGLCPHCSESEETPEHIWLRCPHWASYRSLLAQWQADIESQPPCVRHCLLATPTLPQACCAAWPALQLEAARIWEAREQDRHSRPQALEVPKEPPLPSLVPIPPFFPALGRKSRLNFDIPTGLTAQGGTWPATRSQFNRLTRYLARSRYTAHSPDNPPVTLLETMLDYLAINAQHRLWTGLPESQKGGWLSVQLLHWKQTLANWQRITQCEPPILSDVRHEIFAHGARFRGLPKLPRHACALTLQNAEEVDALLGALRTFIEHETALGDHTAGTEIWRRWPAGLLGTQLRDGGSLPGSSLLWDPPTRVVGVRVELRWEATRRAAAPNIASLRTNADHAFMTPCGAVADILATHGAHTRLDILGLATQWRKCSSRNVRLAQHARCAARSGAHTHERPRCTQCNQVGPTSCKAIWLSARCLGDKSSAADPAALEEAAHQATLTATTLTRIALCLPLLRPAPRAAALARG